MSCARRTTSRCGIPKRLQRGADATPTARPTASRNARSTRCGCRGARAPARRHKRRAAREHVGSAAASTSPPQHRATRDVDASVSDIVARPGAAASRGGKIRVMSRSPKCSRGNPAPRSSTRTPIARSFATSPANADRSKRQASHNRRSGSRAARTEAPAVIEIRMTRTATASGARPMRAARAPPPTRRGRLFRATRCRVDQHRRAPTLHERHATLSDVQGDDARRQRIDPRRWRERGAAEMRRPREAPPRSLLAHHESSDQRRVTNESPAGPPEGGAARPSPRAHRARTSGRGHRAQRALRSSPPAPNPRAGRRRARSASV